MTRDVALFVIECMLRTTLVFGAAALIVAMLPRCGAAAMRHTVWLGAIAGALALPLAVTLTPVVRVSSDRLPVIARHVATLPIATGASSEPSRTNSERAAGATSRTAPRTDASAARPVRTIDWLALGGLAWAIGALVSLVRVVASALRVRRLVARARRLDVELQATCRANNVVHALRGRLYESDEVAAPVTAGWWSPVVILPPAWRQWEPWQLRSVLAHEFAHVTRRDTLAQLVARVACAAYWVNPIIWYVARSMRLEAEAACDARVLASGIEPAGYAELLIGFARNARGGWRSAASLPMSPAGRELARRIDAIVAQRDRRAWIPPRLAAVLGGVLLTSSLGAASAKIVHGSAAGLTVAGPGEAAPVVRPPVDDPLQPSAESRSPSGADVRHQSTDDERIPLTAATFARAQAATATLTGPDSELAQFLFVALEREPLHEADLVRERAAWSLARARGDRLIEPLLDALASDDWREAAYAAWALGGSADARAVPPLVMLLRHHAWRVRANAAASLAHRADPRATPAMRDALDDDAWQVRVEAVRFLGAVHDAASLGDVRRLLADPHIAVRSVARSVLDHRQ